MFTLRQIEALPGNFGEFVEEVAGGLAGLYNPRAAAQYRNSAPAAVEAALRHSAVRATGLCDRAGVAALLIAQERAGAAQITFLHVLRQHAGAGFEARLVEECVAHYRARGVRAIVSECIPFCVVDVDPVYERLGFRHIPRAYMAAPLDAPGLQSPKPACGDPVSGPLPPERHTAAADVILDAYRGHPDCELHAALESASAARDFIEQTARGMFGDCPPAFCRSMELAGNCVAVILGCEAAPGCGFVLQVAVRSAHQGKGLGTRLLRDLAQAFQEHGLQQLALGVTRANPAMRLYERLGFQVRRPVDAYVWRSGSGPQPS